MDSLKDVLEEKSKGNNFISEGKYSKAEEVYKKLLDDIENLLKRDNIENKDEIINQKKLP